MKPFRLLAKLGFGIVLAGASAAVCMAADKSSAARAPELQAVVDCRVITDRDARLNCYDAAAAKLDQAEAAGQVVVVNRDQVRKVRKDVFGLELPSLDIFGSITRKTPGAAGEDLDRIGAVVKTAWRGGDGRWNFELDTGAVWRQVDDSPFANDPHPGSKVEIRKGALGAFFMKVDGQPGFKARRDR
jgi:hypothetical protein